MTRILGRLVWYPADHIGSKTGFNYRDVTAKRINYKFCWIQGEWLNSDDMGTLKENIFQILWRKFIKKK